jgi:probable addiction module antidote protein
VRGDKRTQGDDIGRAIEIAKPGADGMPKKQARKTQKFTRRDPADHMKTEADIAAYLDACIEEAGDDATFIAIALGDIARARGMSQLAKDTGLTREGLYKALATTATRASALLGS